MKHLYIKDKYEIDTILELIKLILKGNESLLLTNSFNYSNSNFFQIIHIFPQCLYKFFIKKLINYNIDLYKLNCDLYYTNYTIENKILLYEYIRSLKTLNIDELTYISDYYGTIEKKFSNSLILLFLDIRDHDNKLLSLTFLEEIKKNIQRIPTPINNEIINLLPEFIKKLHSLSSKNDKLEGYLKMLSHFMFIKNISDSRIPRIERIIYASILVYFNLYKQAEDLYFKEKLTNIINSEREFEKYKVIKKEILKFFININEGRYV